MVSLVVKISGGVNVLLSVILLFVQEFKDYLRQTEDSNIHL